MVLAIASTTLAMAAEPACGWTTGAPFTCVGSFEIHGPGGELGRLRFYANDEMAIDLQESRGTVRALLLLPSERRLSYGIAADAIDVPGKDPMVLAGEGIAWPLGLIIRAYPDGPGTVPQARTRAVVVVGHYKAALTTWRPGPGRIAFLVGRVDDALADVPADAPVDGELVYPRLAPLPDDEPLDGWVAKSGERFARVGNARR